jgi:hypothetical protein
MEEDWDCFRLFTILLRLLPTQPATNLSPKRQNEPKPSLTKMQLQLFFFYHTTKKSLERAQGEFAYSFLNSTIFDLKLTSGFQLEELKPKRDQSIHSVENQYAGLSIFLFFSAKLFRLQIIGWVQIPHPRHFLQKSISSAVCEQLNIF